MSIVYILLFVAFTLFVYQKWRVKREDTGNEPPMFPWALPFVGHAYYFVGTGHMMWNKINNTAKNVNNMGGVARFQLGPKIVYVVTDLEDCLTLANSCLEKSWFYDYAKPWLGDGLLTAPLSKWKNHRKMLSPAFSQKVLDSFIGVFNVQAKEIVKNLEKELGNGKFDYNRYSKDNSLETISLTMLGVDFSNHILNRKYINAVEEILQIMQRRFKNVFLHSQYIFNLTPIKKAQDKCLQILHKMSNTVHQERKSLLNCNSLPERCMGNSTGTKFKPFLDLMIELTAEKGTFSDEEINNHVDTMIFGGHDTSATVVTFVLILLGSHQDVQEKVYQEIQSIFKGSDRDVEKQDLYKLVYLEAVLKETMRLYPVAPLVGRRIDKDVKLKNYTLAGGRNCLLLLQGIHINPKLGPDVNQFKPERWLSSDADQLPTNAAFSLGRRMCVGKTYAYMSMKTTVTHILRNYRVYSDISQLVVEMEVFLNPKLGHEISLERRKN